MSHPKTICLGMALVVCLRSGAQDVHPAPSASAVAQAAARINAGKVDVGDVGILRSAHSKAADDALRTRFPEEQDRITKAIIASALVISRDNDPAYWEYLASEAWKVVVSDMPNVIGYQADGKPGADISPAFHSWAKTERLSEEAAEQLSVENARLMSIMSETADKRSIPILRQGLVSADYFVNTFAAEGLAKLQDDDSLPLIIELCKRVPAEVASSIATQSLMVFNAPAAQMAAQMYIEPVLYKKIQAEKAATAAASKAGAH